MNDSRHIARSMRIRIERTAVSVAPAKGGGTPVTVLQARVETLAVEMQLRAALIRDVRRLALLIDQLLAIARWKGGRFPCSPWNL